MLALLVYASAQVVCLLRLELGCQFADAFQIAVRYSRVRTRHRALNPLELPEVVLQKVTLFICSAIVQHRLVHMIIVFFPVVSSHVRVKIPIKSSRLRIFSMVIRHSLYRRLSDLRGRLLGIKMSLDRIICTLGPKMRAIVQIVDEVVVLFLKPLFQIKSIFQISLVELDLVRRQNVRVMSSIFALTYGSLQL